MHGVVRDGRDRTGSPLDRFHVAGVGTPGLVCAGGAYAWHADSLKLRLLRSEEFSLLQDPNTHLARDSPFTGLSLPSPPTSRLGQLENRCARLRQTPKGRHITTELFRPTSTKKPKPPPEPPAPEHCLLDDFPDPY
jgi:hypothetical protein